MSKNQMITPMVLARRSGVSLHTVRHYSNIGLLKPSRHPHNNYKIYQSSDEIRLHFICAAKEFGFSLAEIAQILEEGRKGEESSPLVKEIISRQVDENHRKLKEMKSGQKQMEKAFGEWSEMKNGLPDGDAVRRLIEAVAGIDESD